MSPTQLSFQRFLLENDHTVNLYDPDLNINGMMWLKNDDVTINNEVFTMLTIIKPLYDPRDYHDEKLTLDSENSNILHHTGTVVPSFAINNVDMVHEQEEDDDNPEVINFPRKLHKTTATAIKGNDKRRLRMTNYKLPFGLKLDHFGNTVSELKKNYRTVEFDISSDGSIKHTACYIYWKVLVDGESRRLEPDAKQVDNPFAEAQKRMSKLKI
jgi:hypothetical protein